MRYRIPGVNFTVHVIKGINYIALLHDVTCLKLKPIPMYRTTYLQPTRRLNHQPRKRHHHSIFQCCRANEITSHQRWSAGRHSFHRLYDDLIPFVCLLLFNPFSLRASQIFRVNQVFSADTSQLSWRDSYSRSSSQRFVYLQARAFSCQLSRENHEQIITSLEMQRSNMSEFRHNYFWIQVFSIFGQIVSMLGRLNDWITIFAGSQGATSLSALGALKRRQQWQEALALLEEHDQHGGTVAVSATKGWSKRLGIRYPTVKAIINGYKSG